MKWHNWLDMTRYKVFSDAVCRLRELVCLQIQGYKKLTTSYFLNGFSIMTMLKKPYLRTKAALLKGIFISFCKKTTLAATRSFSANRFWRNASSTSSLANSAPTNRKLFEAIRNDRSSSSIMCCCSHRRL
jgi:hypothetical protein